MKIYQLHKCGGEWEDSFDIIIGSYLRKERAEEEKAKAEAEEDRLIERSKKCNNCPFIESSLTLAIDELFPIYKDYCLDAELKESEYGIDCDNFDLHCDRDYFIIEEVEVEE